MPVLSQIHAVYTFLPYFFQDPFLHFLIYAYVYLQLSTRKPSTNLSSSLHITSPTITYYLHINCSILHCKFVYLCIYDLFHILLSSWHTCGSMECTAELHLLIATASHPEMQKILIIEFFFENRLHWQFEVKKKILKRDLLDYIYICVQAKH